MTDNLDGLREVDKGNIIDPIRSEIRIELRRNDLK